MLNKNTAPYFDSFDENKEFYQVLYRPSYPIQARELNEMQSILQNQIQRFGNHIFKEGSMVIPGQISLDQKYSYVKIDSMFSGLQVSDYIQNMIDSDVILTGQTSGVTAKIVGYSEQTDSDPLTIYVKYIGSGTNGVVKTFTATETILTDESSPRGVTVLPQSESPVGDGSSVNIQRGVYFVNGKFVLVAEQSLILNKYSQTESAKIGLVVSEQFITPEDDSSLLDNAQGSTNYAAPGAHRHYINLTLSLDDGSSNFIELLSIKNYAVQRVVETTAYSVLADTLERRTYDESGNYTVTPFSIIAAEHRDNNRGEWKANTEYLVGDVFTYGGNTYVAESKGITSTTPPTHTSGVVANGSVLSLYEQNPYFNNGEFSAEDSGDQNKIAVSISAGKAYVLGKELVNTATRFVTLDKTLTYNDVRSGAIPFSLGSYIKILNVFGKLDIASMPTVDIYDRYGTTLGVVGGTKVGTAVARYIEYDSGTVGDSTCKYLLSLINIKMNDGKKFEKDARSIYFDNPTGAKFTSNIDFSLTNLTGSISLTASSTNVVGVGTRFVEELTAGDTIYIKNGSNVYVFNIDTITSNTILTVTAVSPVTISGFAFSKMNSALYQVAESSPIVSMPRGFIRKLRDIDNESVSNTSYYVRQTFSGVVNAGVVTISTNNSTETFASPQQPDSFMITNATTGYILASPVTLSLDSTTATINVGTGANGQTIFVTATVRKTLKERSKTIVRSFKEDFISQSSVLNKLINLSKTDGIKLRKVYSYTNAGTPIPFGSSIPVGATAVDITNYFEFDGGQRDAYYGPCSLTRKVGSPAPTSPIRVEYDYYEHGSLGDYFSVDSYSNQAPVYESESGKLYSLRDCLDFRPDFNGTSFVAKNIPAIGFDVIADYTYYLPRIDKLYLSSNGTFGVSAGIPGNTPQEPAIPSDSMHLATIRIAPKVEVVDSNTVGIEKIDNRRYTMSDIGKIDKRLKNVEYYTALNLLEQQTNNLQLFDENGNLNFKNGFIVDPFSGQNIGDTTSSEFRCSIDPVANIMRPGYSIDNVSFVENAINDSERATANYANNDDIITLKYTEVAEVSQPYATRTESVTPYIRFNYIGEIDMIPGGDSWYETGYAPAVIVNQEGNYNALVNQFQSQLGTVWNAWQTNWSGQTTTTQDGGIIWSNTISGTDGLFRLGNSITTTTTTTLGQVRSGTLTSIQASYDSQLVDDRVIRVDILPWIRSKFVVFKAYGMKPNTLVYPFFDRTLVSQYVTPATTFNITLKNGSFNTSVPAGYDTNASYRRVSVGAVDTQIGVGDVLHNGANNNIALATATAVVLIDAGQDVKVVNVKGTFTPGQTVYGNISGTSGVFNSVGSSDLITNIHGEVSGLFLIPSTDSLKFAAGQKTFVLSSSQSLNSETAQAADTYAEGKYVATGYLNVRQQTIVSTRNGIVNQVSVSENRTVVSTDTTSSIEWQSTAMNWWAPAADSAGGGGGGDPLAQSFTVDSPEGMFVTSVDVYFSAKDRTVPVWFYISEMKNGTPTKNIIPGTKLVIRSDDVNTSSDGSVATRLKMKYPAYLQGNGTEYAIVLGSDSTQYRVFISQLGEKDIITGKFISKQPYLGSLFKSQNASTWDPAQMEDLKFVVNRAKFNYADIAEIGFVSEDIKPKLIVSDAIFTRSGSNKVRIKAYNHGLPVGSNVSVTGATGFNGISSAQLNTQFVVLYTEQDSFVVQVGATATASGFGGGNSIKVTSNIKFDIASVNSTELKFTGTSIRHYITPTTFDYVPYTNRIEITNGGNSRMPVPMLVASPENENHFLAGAKSISSVARLESKSEYISPVLDLRRYSATLIGNRIDSPSAVNNISTLDDYVIGTSTGVSFSGDKISTATAQAIFLQARVGRYVQITGASNSGNNGTFLVTDVAIDGTYIQFEGTSFTTEGTGQSITLKLNDNYVSEISPVDGTAIAKYIMKPLTLDIPARMINIYLDVNKPAGVEVDLYYRLSTGDSIYGFKWVKLAPVNTIKNSENEYSFDGVAYQLVSDKDFSIAQIKVVQRSSTSTNIAMCKNLRLIAMS